MRDYEIMVILRPELDDEGLQTATTRIEDLIARAGGSLVRTTSWGRRRFAYPLTSQRQLGYRAREGYYLIFYVTIPPRSTAALDRDLRLMDDVLRFLTIMREGVALPVTEVPPPPLADNEVVDVAPETDDLFYDADANEEEDENDEDDSDEDESDETEDEQPAQTGATAPSA